MQDKPMGEMSVISNNEMIEIAEVIDIHGDSKN